SHNPNNGDGANGAAAKIFGDTSGAVAEAAAREDCVALQQKTEEMPCSDAQDDEDEVIDLYSLGAVDIG
ncbi:MAG: hypothetical protein ABIA59_04485, partial [Candidatus Latescibacterota bacterium]